MKPNLADLRKSYDKGSLDINEVNGNPISLFETWFKEAENLDSIEEPNAMSLSTIGKSGFPMTRVVLLKGFSEEGFIFFTNYESEKGQSILRNPKVGISFFGLHWSVKLLSMGMLKSFLQRNQTPILILVQGEVSWEHLYPLRVL